MNDKKTPLHEQYLLRQSRGTLQARAEVMEKALASDNGALLLHEAAKIGRHVSQLAYLIIAKYDVPLLSRYNKAVPIFGKAAEVARRSTTQNINRKKEKTDSED